MTVKEFCDTFRSDQSVSGYRMVLEADDSVPVAEFRVIVNHEAKTVRLTSWEV